MFTRSANICQDPASKTLLRRQTTLGPACPLAMTPAGRGVSSTGFDGLFHVKQHHVNYCSFFPNDAGERSLIGSLCHTVPVVAGICGVDNLFLHASRAALRHWLSMSRLQEEFARGVQLSGASLAVPRRGGPADFGRKRTCGEFRRSKKKCLGKFSEYVNMDELSHLNLGCVGLPPGNELTCFSPELPVD